MTQPNRRAGNNWWSPMRGYTIPLHVRNGLYYMDMVPPTDDDMEQYPHVFITADSPWNPDSLDEEFLFDASDSIVDTPGVQERRDSRAEVDLFMVSTTIDHSTHRLLKPDSPLLCIPYLLCLKRFVVAILTLMLSCLISAGWGRNASVTPLKKLHNIIRQTNVSRCASIFDPVSLPLMYTASRNGTRLILLFRTFPLTTTGLLGMADAVSSRSTGAWTRICWLVTLCRRRPKCPQHCKNSSVTMEQWRVLSPITRNRRHPSR